eukprot:NODE_2140_length_1281_cov_68.008117_g1947_i0.p1 GENE.NODE_2140_length_1281_cov_68.008117_g1947_i0~~NODE_2140_length_1281_cov_68.008117_g1947_i0.p1  ORF type:complete len:354 (+),score=53.50 NODE_2140_length_1281_cov_68.008117_g1947_i0:67-1128(+)
MENGFRTEVRKVVEQGIGFKPLSDWMIRNVSSHAALVGVWCEELSRAQLKHVEGYFRILNLVCKNKDGNFYVKQFRGVIDDLFPRVVQKSGAELVGKLEDLVRLWRSTAIFSPTACDRLHRCIATHRKVLKLQEVFPRHDQARLRTILAAHNGCLEAAVQHTAQSKESALQPADWLSEKPITCWADEVDDEIMEAETCSRNPLHGDATACHTPSIQFIAMEEPQRWAYVACLEKRLQKLEDTVSLQQDEIARLSKNCGKLDEFVKEIRVECAKLIQKQLVVERGHPVLCPEEILKPRGRRHTHKAPSPLNPSALPFTPVPATLRRSLSETDITETASTCFSEGSGDEAVEALS